MIYKIKTIDIFEALHNARKHPTSSNFMEYWNSAEEYILEKCGFNRGTASPTSIEKVNREALAFYKATKPIWDKSHRFPNLNSP